MSMDLAPDSLELYTKLVWTDYRTAVVLAVLVPLILLIWALVRRNEAIQHLLIIYWRVSSLLAITVYLMIASLPIGFLAGTLARILIPFALWFWVDLNEEIEDMPRSSLRRSLNAWRWAMTGYCTIGVLFQLTTIPCALMTKRVLQEDQICRMWLEPAWGFKAFFHGDYTPGFLGFLGIVGLIIYVLYLGYFLFFRLGQQGRSAIQR